jgi:hypothetical protein
VTRQLTLRFAPNLVFALDQTFDQADRIAAVLARPEVERDLLSRASKDPHLSKDKVGDAE